METPVIATEQIIISTPTSLPALPPTVVDTLIVSDVHLGSRLSRSRELLETLKGYSFKRLILLGDIFNGLNFSSLNNEHWKVLAYVRELSQKSNIEIVWIEGNHDVGLSKVMSNLVGVKVRKTYMWKKNNERYLAIHGHQFDRFLTKNVILSYLAAWIYELIQILDTKKHRFSRLVKRRSKGWLRLSQKVAVGAIRYARWRGAKYVFCGHTHMAMKKTRRGIHYYNSGGWTDIPSAYITIDGRRGIKIHRYK